MFKLNYASAAILTALCANAFAADDTVFPEDLSTQTDLLAVSVPLPVTSGATLVKATPGSAEAKARSYQGWLNQIKKPYSNQLATGNGTGVTVGIADTGVQVTHPSLQGRMAATYNAFNGGTNVTDEVGHGTHVSGAIAGTTASGGLLEGVAPGAKLAMAKVFTTGSSSSAIIGKGIDWLVNVQKTPIISLSLGSNTLSMQSNIQNAVTKGTLVTAALGNDGRATGSWPAEFAKSSWANGQIIAVGALDTNNKRASFSNYDPTLANWTVFAPGVNIASTYSVPSAQSTYAYMSGTSMATPIVAGEAALIKSNWNFLLAKDIAQIIFRSATHLCSDNVAATVCAARKTADTIYGWGLVNVGAALQPIGSLNVATRTGAVVNFAGTLLATPKSGLASGLKGVNTLAVDSFNRAFTVNLPSSTTASAATQATPVTPITTVSTNGVKIAAALSDSDSSNHTLARLSYSLTTERGNSYGFGTGNTGDSFFGLQATGLTPLSLNGENSRFNAPYFGLAESATHFGYGTTFKNGLMMRVGLVTQTASTPATLMDMGTPVGAKTMTTVELQKTFGNLTGILTLGQLRETNSALGMTGTGALALSASPRTSFITLAGSLPVSGHTVLSAMATMGKTAGYQNSALSLIESASASASAAWSLGLSQKDVLQKGDSLGFSVAMPLKTTSGTMQLVTAVAQSQADGSLQYANQTVSLQPTGTQRDLELAYSTPVRMGGQMAALAQIKLQPGHEAQAPTQFGIGIRYQRAF